MATFANRQLAVNITKNVNVSGNTEVTLLYDCWSVLLTQDVVRNEKQESEIEIDIFPMGPVCMEEYLKEASFSKCVRIQYI